MKAIIKRSKKEFRFNLIGDNGKVIATSESYKRKATLKHTLKKYFPDFQTIDQC